MTIPHLPIHVKLLGKKMDSMKNSRGSKIDPKTYRGVKYMENRNSLLEERQRFLVDVKAGAQSYLDFLGTMARFHKYSFVQQVSLFNHAPANSTAVATAEQWQRMGRTLDSEARPIPILKGEPNRETVEMVYDVSDTAQYRQGENMLWQFDEVRHQGYLDEHFPGMGDVLERVRSACEKATSELTEGNKNLIGLSAAYVVLTRMGYDAEDLAVDIAMMPWQVDKPEEVLTAVNRISGEMLNPLGAYIRKESEANGRDGNANDGRGESANPVAGGVRVGADAVSDKRETGYVEGTLDFGEGDGLSGGLRGGVLGEVQPDIRSDGEKTGRDGDTQGAERDGVDSSGYGRAPDGHGNNNGGNPELGEGDVQVGHPEENVNYGNIAINDATKIMTLRARELHTVAVVEKEIISGDIVPQARTAFVLPYEINVDLSHSDNKIPVTGPFGTVTIRVEPTTEDYIYKRRPGAKLLRYRGGIEDLKKDLNDANSKNLSVENKISLFRRISEDFNLIPKENFVEEMHALMERGDFEFGKDYTFLYDKELTRPGENKAIELRETNDSERSEENIVAPETQEEVTINTSDNTETHSSSAASGIDLSAIDYDADMSTVSGKRKVFQRNLAAIKLVKILEEENREATPGERKLLLSYAGFGGIPEAFNEFNAAWQNEYHAIRNELTDAEFYAARNSTLNAHYTPESIVRSIYQGLESKGFTGGNILEPSAGSGRFFQFMPENMSAASHLFGVELDSLTARIAAKAHPDVTMANQGFESTKFADNTFDLAISNVPFGDYRITSDKRYRGQNYVIHDYFINKMIDEVRPGGIVAAITSKGTMDKLTGLAREELARKAELVTAIRLPNNSMEAAGTEVTADILLFKKREKPLVPGEPLPEWVNTNTWTKDGEVWYVNSYFDQHPENILGRQELVSTAYGKDTACLPDSKINVPERITEIISQANFTYEKSAEAMPIPVQENQGTDFPLGFSYEDGVLLFRNAEGNVEYPEFKEKQQRKILSAMHLRDEIRALFQAERRGCDDDELAKHQKKLSVLYDDHVRLFGRIFDDKDLKKIFERDSSFPVVKSLEVYDETGFRGKADIFTKRTVSPDIVPTHADNSMDALTISMQEKGTVSLAYMSELTGKSIEEVIKDLEFTGIYRDTNDFWHLAEEYLSGDIRQKIEDTENLLADLREGQDNDVVEYLDEGWRDIQPLPDNELEQKLYRVVQERLEGTRGRYDYFEWIRDTSPEEKDYIDRMKDDRRFNLLFAGACGAKELRSTELRQDPLFYLEAMKYGADVSPSYSYRDARFFLADCLNVLNVPHPHSYNGALALTASDHGWYSFLYEKLAQEKPLEKSKKEQKSFLDSLSGEWQEYQEKYNRRKQEIIDNRESEEVNSVTDRIAIYEKNLAALQKVCPEDIPLKDIKVGLGTTWLPADYIQDFLVEELSLEWYDRKDLKVEYEPYSGEWRITGKNVEDNVKVNQTYGSNRINALALCEQALNLRVPHIYDSKEKFIDGQTKEVKILNVEATAEAQMKQEALKDAFVKWIYKDKERAKWIQGYYNRHFNSIRPREYSGEYLKFPGMSPEIELRPHQKAAIAHTLFGGNTLLAHAVGAGKTYEMIASAMESKRLGIANKPLIVVPKHLTEQTGAAFQQLYPGAKVLVATKKDFETANRKEFCARVATQDWDAVVMGYTQFERIPISPERRKALLEAELTELILARQKLEREQGKSISVKALSRMVKKLEARLENLINQDIKDDTLYFEDLGIDRLYVDEAHNFKNLFTYSKMNNIAGLNTSNHADKSGDLYEKCRYINEISDGNGIVFATGTPVSNSMTELYTMQRYLQPERLKSADIDSFDKWASTFGKTATGLEIAPEGKGFREKTRFTKFYNLPELMNMFKEMADIKTADMLNLPVPECEYVVEEIEASPEQKEMVDNLAKRAEKIRAKEVKNTVDNMLKVTNEGRDLALDERNINPDLAEPADSKVKRCVKNVLEVYKSTNAQKGTQLIFCDRSTPKKDGSFSVYDDIKKKLIENGVKPEEIAFIQDIPSNSKNAEELKEKLFAKVRAGEVRVLLGGTSNLGTGTNVQDKLVAIHDLDVPWRPADLEQRQGRIVRVGNENDNVKVFRYVTKGTFDAYMWQLIEMKQRFISQVMTSRDPARETEDIDEVVLSAAEIKAIATGDPLIKEVMDVDNEFNRLKMAKRNFEDGKEHNRHLLAVAYPKRLKYNEDQLALLGKNKERLKAHTHVVDGVEDFSITINGKVYLDRKEAGKVLGEAMSSKNRQTFSGEYKGFKLTCDVDPISRKPYIAMSYATTYTVDVYGSGANQLSALDRITNRVDKDIETFSQKVAQLKHGIELAEAEVKKDFPQEERFKELEERSVYLREVLQAKEALQAKGQEDIKEEDVEREIRMNRIRKVSGLNGMPDLSHLPTEFVPRQYIIESAKYLRDIGDEEKFTTKIKQFDDKATLRQMLDKGWDAMSCVDALVKFSPNLPRRESLLAIAENHEHLREAAQATR